MFGFLVPGFMLRESEKFTGILEVVQLNPVPVFGAKKIPVPFFTEISVQMVSGWEISAVVDMLGVPVSQWHIPTPKFLPPPPPGTDPHLHHCEMMVFLFCCELFDRYSTKEDQPGSSSEKKTRVQSYQSRQ